MNASTNLLIDTRMKLMLDSVSSLIELLRLWNGSDYVIPSTYLNIMKS